MLRHQRPIYNILSYRIIIFPAKTTRKIKIKIKSVLQHKNSNKLPVYF